MKIKYKINEVKPNVFAVVIEDRYDRAMTFLRGQEYYESPNKKFRGKDFSIWDYMKWYSTEYGKGFSYGVDWSGFNIPFDIVWKCYQSNEMETPYDETMWEILGEIDSKMDINKKAYIIGAGDMVGDTFKHEICHGLWYTNSAYKKDAMGLLTIIDEEDYEMFENNLLDMGYTDKVINDEIQAYLCFGHDVENFSKGVDREVCNEYHKQFIKGLNNYIK